MLFTSLDFAWFLPCVFLLYWGLGANRLKTQNFILLVASYVFYGWWDWRFLLLLFCSSVLDFTVGLGLGRLTNPKHRKMLLGVSITANLTALGFFKYFNFFAASYVDLLHSLGLQANPVSLSVILPVGLSFYTFQSISYGIDVYRRHIEPTKDWLAFLAYVSFFPQLVAGPIERASHLLPQFKAIRTVGPDQLIDGANQFLWGMFKKLVIADNCAVIADRSFDNYGSMTSGELIVGLLCFSFQIYGDFSGYSDMAVGTARLFGFSLMRNFRLPYFSRDVAEFWRTWHISLSSWFRDYLYIPLGGSRGGKWKSVRNTLIVFLVSGLWHGANWTFVIWGLLHALYFMPLLLTARNRQHTEMIAPGRWLPSPLEVLHVLSTFCLVSLAWVFFRAMSFRDAIGYCWRMVTDARFVLPEGTGKCLVFVLIMLAMEWVKRTELYPLRIQGRLASVVAFATVTWMVLIWGAYGEKKFIYFQF